MKNKSITYAALALTMALAACTQDADDMRTDPTLPAEMTFTMTHPSQRTRATDTGFENGDKVGLFVCSADAQLEIGGNLVNNEALTCDNGKWNAGRTLYWDDGTYNAYAYYPYISQITSIEDLPFSVSTDQGTVDQETGIDGYEASDLLYARTTGISASADPISLTFSHIMSKVTIRLVKGEDFEGDMPTDAVVYVHNTVPEATVDLSAGIVTRNTFGTRATITARQNSDYMFSAIVVPQRIENRMPLIEVVMKGVSYVYESTFQFKPGTEHLINLIISDNPEQIKIEVGGEIQDWQ